MSDNLPPRSPSRRAQLGFAAILGAVAVVVAAKAESGGASATHSALSGSSTTPQAAPSAGSGSGTSGSGSSSSGASPTPSASSGASSGSTASSGVRSVTGDTIDTRYGPVQVRVVMNGTKITDVVAVQLPSERGRDLEINSFAVPELRQEVLDAQSAQIDTVSGASFTSDGYAQSVQSALDQARG